MALQELDNSNISKHLGQTSQYKSTYDPDLLVREPRQSNRTHLGLNDDNLPFKGGDTWNAYEVSGLTNNGLPVCGVGKIFIPCDGKYIVESKSLKLYFNSFNMTKLGDTSEEVRLEIENIVKSDLSALLEVDVDVTIFSNSEMIDYDKTPKSEWDHNEDGFITIEDVYPVEDIEFSVYQESPDLLEVIDNPIADNVVKYHSALLKSNCRVTSQPDWGDVYIEFKGKQAVDPISLLKYIVSFRDECHFHEEICEALTKRLLDALDPEELTVRCLYARRGGIDINPERYITGSKEHDTLNDVTRPFIKTPKQ
ncbi:NADPH-dependent 7-cyano-7-deazaguanine reductase QueF [bacterium]|nr:NADPH-dependent 7-cyano-7-deazaguanine reductase QueF [bacterium]